MKKKIVEEKVGEEITQEVTSSGRIEEHPEYDPSLPENKQRWTR